MKILVQSFELKDIWKMKEAIFRTVIAPKKIFNLLKIKIFKLLGLPKIWGLPCNILVEPARNCNYACLMCPMQLDGLANFKTENNILPFRHFKSIIDEIGDYLLTIRLWHYGEPLLNPEFLDMVRYAKKKRIFTATSSNLALLTPDIAKGLIESHLDYIIVSVTGTNQETYGKYSGGKGSFDKLIENMRLLTQVKKQKKANHPFVNLQFLILKDNVQEIEAMKKLGKELEVDKLSFKLAGFRPEHKEGLEPSNEKYQLKNTSNEKSRCSLPWEETVICADGQVTACARDVFDEEAFGNVFKDGGFKKIWNNEKYVSFRKKVSRDINKQKFCRDCQKMDNPNYYI